jgi:branched-chain amino acid transport system ATP-binding protein
VSHIPNLKISSLESGYGDLQVLWGLSFELSEGQIVSLIGSNGAGKTTTLRTIAGLIRPYSGTISFVEKRLDLISTEQIVECGVIYVPQGREIFPDMSVLENLQLGSYTKRAREKYSDNLEKVFALFPALDLKRKEMAGNLSGGQAQMLAIGRGLMSSPKVLMLDEPSAGLSPMLADTIFRSIQKLREEEGITILLVEQDAGRSLEMSDYAYVLENGRISQGGSGKELLRDNHVRQAYLGM